jgi:uncharacterized tellurite resistance protein B-like protein
MTTTSSSTLPEPRIASLDAAPSHDDLNVSDATDSFVGRFSHYEEESNDDVKESPPSRQDDDDVGVLLGAIDLLANLASMEAHAYESSLWHLPSVDTHSNSSPLAQPDSGEAPTYHKASSHFPSTIHQSIDALQREYDFDSHTAVSQLVRSVHRLQSNQLCLQRELELRESQVNELHGRLLQLQQQHYDLQSDNSDLRRQLSKEQKDKRVLKEAVRRYQAANESQRSRIHLLEQVNHVLRVRDHEHQMQAKRPRISSDDAPVITGRIPASSSPGSNEAFVKRKGWQCEEDGTQATDASTVTPTSPMRTLARDEDDDASSLPSFIHTIANDGIATIRFPSPADAYETLESFNDASLSTLDDHSQTGSTVSPCSSPIPWHSHYTHSPIVGHCQPFAPYTLTYAMGSKMGLRVRPVELESVQDSNAQSAVLPSRKPLIPTESLMLHTSNPNPRPSMDVISSEDQSFSVHLGSLLGKKPTTSASTSYRPRQAFLVCGYTDAESSSSSSFCPVKKPPIGARIVAVNGQPVGDTWTFAEFLDRMKLADGSRTTVNATNGLSNEEESFSYYTVTFRNDRLTGRQREQLAAPIRGTSPAAGTPDVFDIDDRVASNRVNVVLNVDSEPGVVESSALALPSEPNLPTPMSDSNSTVLRSISSSFWSKAAEMYAN